MGKVDSIPLKINQKKKKLIIFLLKNNRHPNMENLPNLVNVDEAHKCGCFLLFLNKKLLTFASSFILFHLNSQKCPSTVTRG